MAKTRPCKYCAVAVARNARRCPQCGGKRPYPLSSGEKLAAGFLGLVFLGSCCIFPTWSAIWNGTVDSPSDASSGGASWTEQQDTAMAYIMMEKFVKQRLRSPRTAKFPGVFGGRLSQVIYLGDQTYHISSWVDAENGFGATVRTDFVGRIKQTQEGQWQLLSLEMLAR